MPIPLIAPAAPPAPYRPPSRPAPQRHPFLTVALESVATGERVDLDVGDAHSGPFAMPGLSGVGFAEVEHFTTPVPDGHGSIWQGFRFNEGRVFVPVFIGARTYDQLRIYRGQLERIVDPAAGQVRVLVSQPGTGETWHCTGWYAGGLSGDYGADAAGWSWQKADLEFRCPDPLWYGDEVTQQWQVDAATARPLLSNTLGFFPVVLGDSLVAGERVLTNVGGEDAWPTITVTGPGSNLIAENRTTGAKVSITGTIPAGGSVTIDGPNVDVYDDTGADAWDRVPLGQYPWPLTPGANRIRVTLAGATTASAVAVSWRPARRTGH